jgi:uncharacterized protein
MTTNGTLHTEETVRFCAQHKVTYLLSVDGLKDTHDRHRHLLGGGSSWAAVMSRMPLLKRYQPWQGTRMTLHPDTVDTAREGVKYLFRCGINQFLIGPATGLEWSDEALRVYEEQMCEIGRFCRGMRARGAPIKISLFEQDLEDRQPPPRPWGCGAGRGRFCISVQGEIYGCAKILGVDGLQDTHKLGDVWNGITNFVARRALLAQDPRLRPKCVRCEYAEHCGGGCPATNYEATGSLYEPAPLDCKMVPIVRRIREAFHPNEAEQRENTL